MMDGLIQEIGIVGIFALLVIREILARTKTSNGSTVEKMRHAALCKLIEGVDTHLTAMNAALTAQCSLLRDVKKDVEIVKEKVR